MEIIEFIFKLACGIIILLILKYLMSFITGGISKFFGTTSTLNGNIVATPDTLDENIRELKELKNKFISVVNKFKEKSKEKKEKRTHLANDRLTVHNPIGQNLLKGEPHSVARQDDAGGRSVLAQVPAVDGNDGKTPGRDAGERLADGKMQLD